MTQHLDKETFKVKVFDFEKNSDWQFAGDKPAIVDFYADWCQPCKMVAPLLEELADEYKDKIDIYKINTEEQQELASLFGIRSIPSLLFIPMDDKPQMAAGALPKETFVKVIEDVLKVASSKQMN
jgi:thioredoxin